MSTSKLESSRSDVSTQALRVLKATVAAWSARVFTSSDRQRDSYLAGAVDRIDLEQRIRNWERRPTPFWDNV